MRSARMVVMAALVGGVLAGTVTVAAAGSGNNDKVIKAEVLVGVQPPFTGATNAIRGVPGGGAPWVIADADVELRANGRIKVDVEGLVIDPTFPNPAIAGINPVAQFKATVSCLTPDGLGGVATVNVSTAGFPADTAGDSRFDTTVDLPKPCVAPIVFVANGVAGSNGAWFAATGV